jgi:hypothetical protein
MVPRTLLAMITGGPRIEKGRSPPPPSQLAHQPGE